MLSVVVVHKDGDQRPGSGFFDLAAELGYIVTDRDQFWIEMLRKVYGNWARRPGATRSRKC
jgi:hypothetical protein